MSRMESTQGWVDRHKQTALQNYSLQGYNGLYKRWCFWHSPWDSSCLQAQDEMPPLESSDLPVHLLGLDSSDSILIPKTLTKAIDFLPWFSRFEWKWSRRKWHYWVWFCLGFSEEWTFHCLVGLPKDRGIDFPFIITFPHGSRSSNILGILPNVDLWTFAFPRIW